MGMEANVFGRSARIALIYAGVAGAWIVFSDNFVQHAPPDVAGIPNQTVKGLLFVLVTAALLFALMARSLTVFRQRVIHMSTHDQLTALPTIEVLRDRVEQAIIHAKRAQAIVVVLTLNVDRFQHVVNSYGFAAGDVILKGIASRLVELTRPGDSVCRIGGDEFIVALFDIRDRRDVDRLVSKLRDGIAQGLPYRGEVVRFSVSCGVAIYPCL